MNWKKILVTAALIFGLYVAYRFYDQQFRLENIKARWSVENAAPISAADKEKLQSIFSQPFDYLDRGKQSYVFVSHDDKYVVKFFDSRCQQSGAMPLIAPVSAKRCARKYRRLVKGYTVAETYDKDNTGLIYAQLAPDPSYSLKVDLNDRFGFKQQIDLAEVPFSLQLKAIPTRVVITQLLKTGDVAAAKERFGQIVDMYVAEYKRGVVDLDHNVMYNTGFVDGHPIRIDVGRLTYNENVQNPEFYKNDLEKVAVDRVTEWLGRHFPTYQQEITAFMKDKLTKN